MNPRPLIIFSMINLWLSSSFINLNSLKSNEINTFNKKEICKDPIGYNMTEVYDTLWEYGNTLHLRENDAHYFMSEFLTKNSWKGLMDSLPSLFVYVFMFGLAVLTFLLLPMFHCMRYKEFCLFNTNRHNKKAGLVFYSFAIVACILLMITAVPGYVYSTDIIEDLDDSTCILATFLDHTLNGQTPSPILFTRWAGVPHMRKTIDTLSKSLDNINAIQSITLTNINTARSAYKAAIDEMIKTTKDLQIIHPDGTTTTLTPTYITSLTTEFKDSLLEKIKKEENYYLTRIITQMTNYTTQVNNIQGSIPHIQQLLFGINEKLTVFQEILTEMNKDMVESMISLSSFISNWLIITLQVILGIILVTCFFMITVISLYVFAHFYCLKKILHAFWNIMMVIITISFLIGGAFGIIGKSGISIVPALNYIFNNGTSVNYINTCVNGNGDLSNALGIISTDSSINAINKLYENAILLRDFHEDITRNNYESYQVRGAGLIVSQYKTDLYSTLTNEEYQKELIKANNACSSTTNGYFVLHLMNCSEGWKDPQEHEGQNDICFVVGHDTNMKFCTQEADANVFIKNIRKSIDDNIDKINDGRNALDVLQAKHLRLGQELVTVLKKYIDSASGILSLNTIIDRSDFMEDMANCNFLKDEIIHYAELFGNHSAKISKRAGEVIIVCGFFGFILNISVILTIYYFHDHNKNGDVQSLNQSDKDSDKNSDLEKQQDVTINNCDDKNFKLCPQGSFKETTGDHLKQEEQIVAKLNLNKQISTRFDD